MFNLIVSNNVEKEIVTLGVERIFEFTKDEIIEKFKFENVPDFSQLQKLHVLLMEEGVENELAKVGNIVDIKTIGRHYSFQFVPLPNMPVLTNKEISSLSNLLQIDDFEFSRNHWAIKDADLFKALYTGKLESNPCPSVFNLTGKPINKNLIAFMMPFDALFRDVYDEAKAELEAVGFQCNRADDIWNNQHILDDIIELIETAAVVVCDLSKRNPNVFYEAGIAHTLGKEVILLTQSDDDVPFDLRSIRYIKYLNNDQGRQEMIKHLIDRVGKLTSK